jgi:hypothetical protein
MRAHATFSLAAALFAAVLAGAEVQRGDSLDHVRNTLGAPRGELSRGDIQVLVYDRGEVELRDGVVSKVLLRSADEQAAYAQRAEEQNARARQENEARRARLLSEGEALKERKLADPNFVNAPASAQLSFWLDFARAYPEVPVADLLLSARNRVAAEYAADERRRRQDETIAALERRVAEAEARAEAPPQIVAPISYPYYPIYRRHPRHRPEPDHPVNFFPMQYPEHIGLGSPRPPEPRMPPVIGYDPLLPRRERPMFERRR